MKQGSYRIIEKQQLNEQQKTRFPQAGRRVDEGIIYLNESIMHIDESSQADTGESGSAEDSIKPGQLYHIRFEGDVSEIRKPGQFVNIKVNGPYLRRPISVCDWSEEDGTFDIVFKTIGEGTLNLAAAEAGDELDILTGLGNGFDTSCAGQRPLVVGGGMGAAPLYGLVKTLIKEGLPPENITLALGFGSVHDAYMLRKFRALGARMILTTMDGSTGIKGTITGALDMDGYYSQVYACGPLPMLKAVYNKAPWKGQYSFEERMGCGFGACMGCTCRTKDGYKRICTDGPVLRREEIVW